MRPGVRDERRDRKMRNESEMPSRHPGPLCGAGRSNRHQVGQSLVEFALVLPAFLLTFIGVVDFGWGIYHYNSLSHLAREGARAAVVRSSAEWEIPGNSPGTYGSVADYIGTNTIVGRIASQAATLDLHQMAVTISAPQGVARYLPVTVRVSYPFRPLLANWLSIAPIIDLRAEATMRIE